MESERPNRKVLLSGIVLVLLILVAASYETLNTSFIRKGRSKRSGIINVLRQIDSAKQRWALENGITAATNQPTEQNLLPYLNGRTIQNGKFGEKYIINPLNLSPEAHLTVEVEGLPKGTVILVGGKIIPPDGPPQTNQTFQGVFPMDTNEFLKFTNK